MIQKNLDMLIYIVKKGYIITTRNTTGVYTDTHTDLTITYINNMKMKINDYC